MAEWRDDKFAVGDRVIWSNLHCVADLELPKRCGDGPFRVERVQDEPDIFDGFEWRLKGMGHTQYVWVNGTQYSGAYFEKVQLQ